MFHGRPPSHPAHGWTIATLIAATVIASCSSSVDDNDNDNDCIGKDLFGDNFDCSGPDFLYEGQACWAESSDARGYRVVDATITRGAGVACVPGTYCHPTRGCQPLIATGEACDGLPRDALAGMCSEPFVFCYTPDPEGRAAAAERVCRPLPTTEGAFCDQTLKPDCDDYRDTASEADYLYEPAYAWQATQGFDHPEWEGSSFTGQHLVRSAYAPTYYPALRLVGLLCRDNRCVKPPAPGEPCADIAGAAGFTGSGPLRFICAQSPEFTVRPATRGGGFGGAYDYSKAVYCIEGRCTPASELPPDTCFAPDGATAPLDPSWCSSPAETCRFGDTSCLSPCRSDGTCGMCEVCLHEDGTRDRIKGSGDCVEQGNSWEVTTGLVITDYSSGDLCGYGYQLGFEVPGPVTGELWLKFGGHAAFSVPGAAFDLFVDGTLLRRWRPGAASDCLPVGAWEPTEFFEVKLDSGVAADGRVRVEFRGTSELCTGCRDTGGCPSRHNCSGNELTVYLQNRTRDNLGLIRDDRVCRP